MINRKIDNRIENFYKNHNKALLLTPDFVIALP